MQGNATVARTSRRAFTGVGTRISRQRLGSRALAAGALAVVLGACADGLTDPQAGVDPAEVEPSFAAAGPGPVAYFQICKVSVGTPAVTGTFNYSVAGAAIAPNPFSVNNVPVGGCSNLIEANAGTLAITEALPAGVAVDGVVFTGAPGSSSVGNVATLVLTAANTEAAPAIVTFRNRRTQPGTLKVCKVGIGAVAGQSFGFTLTGQTSTGASANQTFNIVAGAGDGTEPDRGGLCVLIGGPENPTLLQGPITIVEGPAPAAGIGLQNIFFDGAVIGGSANLGTRTASFTIGEGENVVTFVNAPQYPLLICKIRAGAVPAGYQFTFTAGGNTFNVAAGEAPTGNCVVDGVYFAGQTVTVVESFTAIPNVSVTTAAAPGGPATFGAAFNPVTRTATVVIGVQTDANVPNRVTFTNTGAATGLFPLEVCKVAGTGVTAGTVFGFTTTATGGTVFNAAAGAAPATAPGATPLPTNCVVIGQFASGTSLTITEGAVANTAVSAVAFAGALSATSFNLGARTATVTTGAGAGRVTFTNVGTGTVQLCKVAGNAGAVGQPFQFTVANVPGVTSATRTPTAVGGAGACAQLGGAITAGTVVSVTELAIPGFIVFNNVYTRTATIVAGQQQTITFMNFRARRLCTLTQGFYKNHGPNSPGNQEDEITATLAFGRLTGSPLVTSSGTLALILNGRTYTAAEIEAAIGDAKGGGANAVLRQQLAAALNLIAIGVAATPDNVEAAIAAGINAELLAAFNEGRVGPGHCDD